MQIEKVYEPQRFEPHWAQWWIDSEIFRASHKAQPRVFSLVIPPPNVTGSLHIGHALGQAKEFGREERDCAKSLPRPRHAYVSLARGSFGTSFNL